MISRQMKVGRSSWVMRLVVVHIRMRIVSELAIGRAASPGREMQIIVQRTDDFLNQTPLNDTLLPRKSQHQTPITTRHNRDLNRIPDDTRTL